MAFDLTSLLKTGFQENEILKISKILSEMLTHAHISGRIQNMRWTQLEYTSNIMLVGIENTSFGYNLMSEIWISEGPPPATGGPYDF